MLWRSRRGESTSQKRFCLSATCGVGEDVETRLVARMRVKKRRNAAGDWPERCPADSCHVFVYRGTRAFAELFGGFPFNRAAVIHDAFGPAVNARPAVTLATAVL